MFPSCRSVVALALVLAALPLIVVSRIVLACLRTVAPSLVARVEQKLPYAIPNLTKPSQPAVSTLHVAVIGGGIAGMGAAFALKRAGARVTVFEPREALGGNAKTANWLTRAGAVRTGLSVLAWPKPYFHNYNELLSQLNVPTTSVNLPFAVREPGKFTYYHDSQESKAAFASDLRAFQRVVGLVKLVNWCFECASAMPSALVRMCSFGRLNPVATSHAKSVYTFHFLSPMNVIPLRTFCLWMGMSRHFWDTVATPIWSSTFLTGDISTVPSSIAPVLNDIMPLHGECTLETWQGDSSEVFDRMAAGVEVRLRTQVVSVGLADDGKVNVGYVHGHASNCHMFDRAVFACPAEATAKMLVHLVLWLPVWVCA
jgi:predicted NAD/FAD-binding protein